MKTKYRTDGNRLHRYGNLKWPRDSALESWSIKIQKHLSEINCAYIFAGNHYEGYVALTAQRIAKQFGVPIELPPHPFSGDCTKDTPFNLL